MASLKLAIVLITASFFLLACSPAITHNRAEHSAVKNAEAGLLADAHIAPEPASTTNALAVNTGNIKKTATGQQYVAVTANPLATAAAFRVLEQGGTAIDAAIAAQMVLGLVEPQSSGIGGGGFLLFWDATAKKLISYDGRETAPLKADESLFIDPQTDKPMSFFKAIIGGRSVGVPGMLKMLDTAHQQYGKLGWNELFSDAIYLAENGFEVSARLHTLISKVPALTVRPNIAEYLFNNEQPLPQGYLLKNSAYAQTLHMIANQGANAFYQGEIASAIVKVVNADVNAGQLSKQDLLAYKARVRGPVCKVVFDYKVCGMGPPSSGATTVISILAMLENSAKPTAITKVSEDPELAHTYIEASRLAFADRNTYIADPDFVNVPVQGLLDSGYLKRRAGLIKPAKRAGQANAGLPAGIAKNEFITNAGLELPSTTHLSIVDRYGNIVSMTSSIETAFGSRLMAGGFILNNQLTDFSFAAHTEDRQKIANRVQAGKRPTSSMSPTIVFDKNNQPVMVIGSPGGKGIIGYVARVLYETLALNRPLSESISDKHIIDTGGQLRIESGSNNTLVEALKQKGHQPELRALTSGIHALQKTNNGWLGVADPRREGTVLAH